MMLFQEYRSQISGATGKTWSPTYAHNSFIQLTAETGLLSLAMFGWILGGVFYYPLQAKRREDQGQGSEFQDLKIIMLGCLAAVLAFCIHGLAENNFYSLQLSSLFWVMVGLVFSSVKLLNKAEPCDIKRHA